MTFLEAVNAIEKRLDKVGMKDKFGNPLFGIVALGRIGNFHGARFDNIIDQMETAQITVEVYFTEMMKMIIEYEQRERKLT